MMFIIVYLTLLSRSSLENIRERSEQRRYLTTFQVLLSEPFLLQLINNSILHQLQQGHIQSLPEARVPLYSEAIVPGVQPRANCLEATELVHGILGTLGLKQIGIGSRVLQDFFNALNCIKFKLYV